MVGRGISQIIILLVLNGAGASIIDYNENCTSGNISWIKDGWCDDVNNNEGCLYDGGDCCECTRIDIDSSTSSFSLCVDPSASCYDPAAVFLQENCTDGVIEYVGDGRCDVTNNNEECLYDGGDCCECTRIDIDSSTSSSSLCVDPSASCYDPAAVFLQENCTDGIIEYVGDGRCDVTNNNEECLFDGGDCCECASVGIDSSTSSFSLCVDPSASCYDPAAATLQSNCTDGNIEGIGDGHCDLENNNYGCLFDGGDCCACTRMDSDSSNFYSEFLFCLDPSASCYNPAAIAFPSNCTYGNVEKIGDGHCDIENNNDVCLFDGGDCCECTRIGLDSSPDSSTGLFSLCVDPGAPCYDPAALALQASCTDGNIEGIGDGRCDVENNNEWCLYDGGDCCHCTCIHGSNYDCGVDGYTCLDPDATNLEAYICEEIPSVLVPCSAGYQQKWVVENTSQARTLSETVRCSGGSFNVKWKGKIVVDKPISVFGGTVLNVSGTDVDAVINGSGENRLFSVVNASLNLSNITVGNGNTIFGGAIAASYSRLSFERVALIDNTASMSGGAMVLLKGSFVSFGGDASFLNNTALSGGAISMMGGSDVSWTGNTTFSYNAALDGGALYVMDGSKVSWTGNTTFSYNAATSYNGGGLYLTGGSSAIWTAESRFVSNNASNRGGGLYVTDGSNTTWTGLAVFSGNTAHFSRGGALFVTGGSNTVWTAPSHFLKNTANYAGGALGLKEGNALWGATSLFLGNKANNGGALFASTASSVIWTAASVFRGNSAEEDGGAAYVKESYAAWGGNKTVFEGNNAENGGALFFTKGATVEWSGETIFTSNMALLDGGAMGSTAIGSEVSVVNGSARVIHDKISLIAIKGIAAFVDNMCKGNGGAMALVQSLNVSFQGDSASFSGNSAGVSGGAVFITGTGIGPAFTNVTFVGNSAPTGGGVRVTESGTSVTVDSNREQVGNPTKFYRCRFIGNTASGTGGAVDSASGQDVFNRSLFEGNRARVGGALRLAGKASINSCFFVENVSELGEGPAVSNIGYMSNVTNAKFHENTFNCPPQTFLDFKKSGKFFETVCDGCPSTCVGCSFGTKGTPTCTSLVQAGVEHATSRGGSTTVEELEIHRGYWRATKTSTNVIKCFNTKACKGGLTGSPDYCHQGYKGPYCSICSKNYASNIGFTCRECSERTMSITAVVVLGVLASVFGLSIILYLTSVEMAGCGEGIVDFVTRLIPLTSIKIIIITWQILTQFASVTNVTFPNVYQKFLDGVDFLNFDLSLILSAGCFLEVDFHDRLLWTTITPLVITGVLSGTYAVAMRRNRRLPHSVSRITQHKHISMALLVAFLVYSSVSSVVFQAFACDDLDNGKRYLRADYKIDCNSPKHRAFQIYAGLMLLLYPVGIPAVYTCLLFKHRYLLQNEHGREESSVVRSISSLWKPYKAQRFYYEVIECARRILLAGAVVFVYPNTVAQIAVAFAIAIVFVFVSEGMAPYQSPWDAWIGRMGHVIVFSSMYLILLLKVDVSGENASSQRMFEVVLVVCHGCMILVVMVQTVIMMTLLKSEKTEEQPHPRFRQMTYFTPKNEVLLEEENDGCKDDDL